MAFGEANQTGARFDRGGDQQNTRSDPCIYRSRGRPGRGHFDEREFYLRGIGTGSRVASLSSVTYALQPHPRTCSYWEIVLRRRQDKALPHERKTIVAPSSAGWISA